MVNTTYNALSCSSVVEIITMYPITSARPLQYAIYNSIIIYIYIYISPFISRWASHPYPFFLLKNFACSPPSPTNLVTTCTHLPTSITNGVPNLRRCWILVALPVPPSDVVVPHSATACLPPPQPLPTKPKEHHEKPGDVELQGMALAFVWDDCSKFWGGLVMFSHESMSQWLCLSWVQPLIQLR